MRDKNTLNKKCTQKKKDETRKHIIQKVHFLKVKDLKAHSQGKKLRQKAHYLRDEDRKGA